MNHKFKLLIALLATTTLGFGQNGDDKNELPGSVGNEVEYRHSIGASFFMLGNFLEDSPDYYLFTYGNRLNEKERIFVEFNTWKYAEPLGTYGNSEELYPGFVRAMGVGVGYQRFLWKGVFSTVQATPFLKQYYDSDKNKIQNGFQLYLQLAAGYRFEFFKDRAYLEPAIVLKYWPIDTNFPDEFKRIEEGAPKTIFEPSLNFGWRF